MTTILRWSALVLVAALATVPATAQETDSRWLPWIGCWEAVASEETPETDDLLCIRPAASGVEAVEVVAGRPGAVQTLIADGQPRAVTVEGCEGWRSVEFSLDGQRLFTRAEQACEGDERRPSTGVIVMVSPHEWIDVQTTAVGGEALSWVRRFRSARPQLAQAAGFGALAPSRGPTAHAVRAAAPPDVDDVIEASQAIGAEAVRSWVAELNDPFDLNAERLVRLADAGVPESVIDVMIAVSYPRRFALQRDGDIEELEETGYARTPRRYGRRTILAGPGYWDPFYSRYRPFGYGPFGYGYSYGSYGFGSPYGGIYSPGVVIVVPRSEGAENARVVRGRGYTRGGSSSTREGSGSAEPRSARAPRRNDQPSAGGSAPRSSRPSASSGAEGSSSGSSGERQAKPR